MKNKLSIFKFDKSKTNYLFIVLIFSTIFAFMIYYVTKQVLFSLMFVFLGVGSYFLYASKILENNKNKSLISEGKIYIEFYKNFELFSSLENDYQTGFNKAVELLPICKLKERLTDYLENSLPLEEALVLISSRSEFRLITEVKRSLLTTEDFYDKNNRLSMLIERYSKEILPKQNNVDYSTLGILLFACYIIIAVLLVYVSKV